MWFGKIYRTTSIASLWRNYSQFLYATNNYE